MRATRIAFLCWSVAGCGREDGVRQVPDAPLVPSVVTNCTEQRWLQDSLPQVDVLFVVDNSPSMGDNQGFLGDNAPLFMASLDEADVDYHVGVVTTDLDDEATAGRLVSENDHRFVDRDTPDGEAVLASMMQSNTDGSSIEQGFGAAWLALGDQAESAENAGFYRADAMLHVVFVADEDDATDENLITLSDFVAWFDQLKDDPQLRAAHGILGAGPSSERYREAIGGRGTLLPIESDDWGVLLDDLELDGSVRLQAYPLTGEPDLDSIEVHLRQPSNGGPVLQQGVAWSYDPTRNAIVLEERAPEPGETVIVNYCQRRAEEAQSTDQ